MHIQLPTRNTALKGLQLIATLVLAACGMFVLNFLLGEAPSPSPSGNQAERTSKLPVHQPGPRLATQQES